jgi:hypothetical protein
MKTDVEMDEHYTIIEYSGMKFKEFARTGRFCFDLPPVDPLLDVCCSEQ